MQESVLIVGAGDAGERILREIIKILEPKGIVVLNSERELPEDLQKYVFDFHKNDVAHYIANSKLFISDSTTMCAEAAVLGIPAIEIDDWFADFKQYEELKERYSLLFGFGVEDIEKIKEKIEELTTNVNIKAEYKKRQEYMLTEKIDASAYLIWMIENYPESSEEFFKDKTMQLKFR